MTVKEFLDVAWFKNSIALVDEESGKELEGPTLAKNIIKDKDEVLIRLAKKHNKNAVDWTMYFNYPISVIECSDGVFYLYIFFNE